MKIIKKEDRDKTNFDQLIYEKYFGAVNQFKEYPAFTQDFVAAWMLLTYMIQEDQLETFRVDYIGYSLNTKVPQWGCVLSTKKIEGEEQKHYQSVEATDAMAVGIAALRMAGYEFE